MSNYVIKQSSSVHATMTQLDNDPEDAELSEAQAESDVAMDNAPAAKRRAPSILPQRW